jgi:hypothetical protein
MGSRRPSDCAGRREVALEVKEREELDTVEYLRQRSPARRSAVVEGRSQWR